MNPLPIIVLTLFFVAIRKKSRFCALLGFTLYLIGTSPVADLTLRPLEGVYKVPKAVDPDVGYVVVLTGGIFSRGDAVSSAGCSSIKRLVSAVDLCNRVKGCTLIVSGGSVLGSPSGAKVLEEVAEEVGDCKVVVEEHAKTTYENALFVKSIVKRSPFYLVTSAYHMPRAVMLFKALGMRPIPYPSDFLVERNYRLSDLFPMGRNVRKVEITLHEYLALGFYTLKLKVVGRLLK